MRQVVGAEARLAPRRGASMRSPPGSTRTTQVPVVRSGSVLTHDVDAGGGQVGGRLAAEGVVADACRRTTCGRPEPRSQDGDVGRRRRRRDVRDGSTRVSLPRRRRAAHRGEDVGLDVADHDDVERLGAAGDGHAGGGDAAPARSALRSTMRTLASSVTPPALAVEVLEQEGRHVLAADPGRVGCAQPVARAPVVQGGVELLVRGSGLATTSRGRRCRGRGGRADGGDLLGGVDPTSRARCRSR